MSFIPQLLNKIEKTSPVVVGIDPNFDYLSSEFLPKSNNPKDLEDAIFNFSKQVIDGTFDLVPAIKPQIAYFEQFGLAGLQALTKVIKYAKSKDLLVILDVKRGDIGSTSENYAKAYLQPEIKISENLSFKNEFLVDCITINPFLGMEAILPIIEIAVKNQKGIFVLIKTSNPGSHSIQNLKNEKQETVSEFLAKEINDLNQKYLEKGLKYGPIGVVVGSTYPLEAQKLRKILPNGVFLVPGTGSQGGTIKTALNSFNPDKTGAIIPISRAITYPDFKEVQEFGFQAAVRKRLKSFVDEFKQSEIYT